MDRSIHVSFPMMRISVLHNFADSFGFHHICNVLFVLSGNKLELSILKNR